MKMVETSLDTVKVFDTLVNGKRGKLHFDVMTTDEATALRLAKQHLATIGEADATVTAKECQFCHSEPLVFFSVEQQRQIKEQGGFIVNLPA
jgi:heterodisulfide reductase subunit B